MIKTTYFTAAHDDEVTSALDTTPTGAEVLTSGVAPDSDAFTILTRLIAGTEAGSGQGDGFIAYKDVVTYGTRSLVRLGSELVAEIADRDAAEFAELAAPWERSGALADQDGMDVPDFLIDLQHLCRNAIAEDRGVYAVESF
ncbi:MAG: hypothetical protein J2P23_06910 [Microlunatus sp.]|nr:hypothetical protein [Microlunatus sp.]